MKTFTKSFGTKFFAVLLSVLLSSPYAFAGEVGRITYVEGRVDVSKPNSEIATPVREGDVISVGDAVRTKSNSKVEVTFNDKSVLRLAQNSKAEVEDYQLDEGNRRKTANLRLDRGKARTIIAKMPNAADFIISTPNAEGRIKGSDVYTFHQAGNSGMLVANGKLSVINIAHPEEPTIVPAGNSVLVPLDELPKGPRAYFELEKKLHEQDTSIPVTISKREKSTIIKGVITKISGKVSITNKGATAPRDATINDIIGEGDKIETGDNGMIEIKFDNGNAINLKPGTNLLMGRLVFDPATGEYENLFESSAGKIRARIENLKGKSKFEVKTPTAVSGARGTIMYLVILSNLTTSFFEGGGGYLNNLISGINKILDAGQNASADGQGNVSDPGYTSDADREAYGEGWDPGSGTEGYSAPEGATGTYLFNSDTGTGAEGGLDAPDFGGGEPFSGLPFTEANPTGGGTTTTTTSITTPGPTPSLEIDLAGGFLNPGSFEFDPDSSLDATLASETTSLESPWSGIEVFNVATGAYSNPNGRDLWFGNVQGTGADGGSIVGWMGGAWHSWEGVLSTLYIDPSGIVGLIFGYLSGTNDDASTGTLTGSGDIFIIPMKEMPVLPPIVVGRGSGELYALFTDREGYINTSFTRDSLSLMGETWGIWRDAHTAEYDRPNEPNSPDGRYEWTGVAGGSYNEDGYFITTIEGIDDLNGALRMDIASAYIDADTLGAYAGIILGTYTEGGSYYYEGVGLGTFEEKALTFSGYWGEDSLYYNDGGYLEWAGKEYGLIGSTQANWWSADSFSFIAMGRYNDEQESGPYIWNTPIYSDDGQGNYTTQDDAAFFGFTGGIWKDGEMDGAVRALYVDPNGNTGILKGDVSGDYYPDLSMWMDEGTLAPTQVESSGFDPEDFDIYTESIDDNRGLYGDFEGSGKIVGKQYSGYTYSIDPDDKWGIFDIKLGDENYYEDKPEGVTNWSGVMGGVDVDDNGEDGNGDDNGVSYWLTNLSGTWQNNEIRAGVTGHLISDNNLGTIEGKLFGVNDGADDTWVATVVGSWIEKPLTFSGFWGDELYDEWRDDWDDDWGYGEDWSLYYNDEGYPDEAGEDYGLIGSAIEDWWAQESFPILAMGEYDDDRESEEPYIWNTPIYSYSIRDNSATTQDGGAFYGFTAGLWNNLKLDGAAALLYTDPDGNAGILWGDVTGSYYLDLEMWMATGTLTPYQMARDLEIYPEDFIEDYIDYDNLYADVDGWFGDYEGYVDGWSAWGKTYFIVDDYGESQPWGIYDLKLEGSDSYYNPEGSKIWAGEIEGTGYFGYNESQGVMRGKLFGVYDEPDDEGYGTWIGTSVGAWYAHNVDDEYADDAGAYYGFIGGIWEDGEIVGGMAAIYVQPFDEDWEWDDDILRWGDISACILPPLNSGSFEGGGNITLENFDGRVAGIIDQPWGIWGATMNGSYTGPTSPWKLALGGTISGEDYPDSYWFGTLNGESWADGRLEGDFRGFLFAPKEGADEIKGGAISGGAVGTTYIDVDEDPVTRWEAAGVGEWVEVTELLDPAVFGPAGLQDLNDFVSVPITEVYSSVMAGNGAFNIPGGGAISAIMDMSFYATSAAALDGIWAALINGTYTGPTDNSWTVNVTNTTGDAATLTGTQWENNQWLADVTGATSTGTNFSGQAGGTYNDDANTFSGVGAGTWNAPQP